MTLFHTFHSLTLLLWLFVFTCYAQNYIQITAPISGQTVTSKSRVDISYTVIGAQTMNPVPVNATYPSSMESQFQWLQKGTQGNPLTFKAVGGLDTHHYAAGIQDKKYTAFWNTPGCHFFSRYNPSNYDFQLAFIPVYSDNVPSNTPQEPIIIPLNIQVNNATFPKC